MLNWISNLFNGQRDLRDDAPHIEAVAMHNGYMGASSPVPLHDAYTRSAWVYVAVKTIAEAAALVPLHVAGQDDRHPLAVLLGRPNPTMSRFELFEQTIGALELTGNAYWYLVGDAAGMPAQIWPLRPDRMRIVPHPEDHIAGYIYEIDGQQIPFEAVEVVHFKRWHPYNDYYGLSALEAARYAVQTDAAMSAWNQATFGQNNGIPAGIVSIKEFVSDTDFDRIKREWRASYGGPQRRTAFLRGSGIEWHDIGLNHRDMDYLQGRRANRDEIFNIFGVPIGLISENATEANARVAERTFIERTLWPKLVRLAGKITQEMMPFYGTDFVAQFEDIRPTDNQLRLAEIRAAYPVMSVNEIRERFYQLPPIAWGERPVSGQEDDAQPTHEGAKSALDELAQWERFTLRRLGQPTDRPFKAHVLPDDLVLELSATLAAAGEDADAIKAVFASMRERLQPEDDDDTM